MKKRIKHLFRPLMAIGVMLASLVPQCAWAELKGDGSLDNPYQLEKYSDLEEFQEKTSTEPGLCAILNKDITIPYHWGLYLGRNKPYKGTFDGNGKTIHFEGNSWSSVHDYAGLFEQIDGATIKNFTISGEFTIKCGNAGSVAGSAKGDSKILNITSSCKIIYEESYEKKHIGGIVGQILQVNGKTVEIKGCTYSGTMDVGKSTDSNGGIVGYCEKNANVEIENCFFNGSIITQGDNPRIGGILGYADDDGDTQNFKYIRNCFVSGTLTPSTGTDVGIFAGCPRGKVVGVITNNTYVSDASTNMLGNSYQSKAESNGNKKITISVTAGAGGTVSQFYANPTTTTATLLGVEATPDSGYDFVKWSDKGVQKHYVELTDNVSITATFEKHTYGDWVTDKAATCTAGGTKHRVCTHSGCSARENGTIDTLSHNMTKHAAVDATCTEKGISLYYTCSHSCCSDKYYKDNGVHTTNTYYNLAATEIAALGHDYPEDYIVDNLATCYTEGSKHRDCQRQGCKAQDIVTIPAIGGSHNWVDMQCSKCGVAPSVTHSEVCGTCTWTVYEDQTMIIEPIDGISGTLDNWGDAYSSYAPWKDYGINGVKTVKFRGEVIASTCNRMFMKFYSLKSIEWGNFNTANVAWMCQMFVDCRALKTLDLSSFETEKVENMEQIFFKCNVLENLTIGNFDMNKVTLLNSMFTYCNSLNTLTLKSIPYLDNGTFNSQFTGEGKTVKYELDDESSVYCQKHSYLPTATTVTYNRTATKDTMTIILPYDVPAESINGTAYKFVSFDGKNLEFEESAEGIKANTPYLVKVAEKDQPLVDEVYDVEFVETKPIDVTNGKATHFGLYEEKKYLCQDGLNYYAFIDNQFYHVLDLTVPAFRTAILLEGESGLRASAPSSLGVILRKGNVTKCEEPTNEFAGKVNVYDTLGRAVRLNVEASESLVGLPDGVYMVNGKKIVVTNNK